MFVAGKQPALQYLTMDEAIKHCTYSASGSGVTTRVQSLMWSWLAAAIFQQWKPWRQLTSYGNTCLISRFAVNIVDLMALQPKSEHPHGITDVDFETIFTLTNRLCLPSMAIPG